jgi:glutathione S-transferase
VILYYAPGACSLADHIALIEAGLACRLVGITRDKRTDDGRDFLAINPRGYVPALELDDGTVLTENLAILAYIAHQARALLPEAGLTRWRALEATSFMTTEVHGNYKALFASDATEAEKDKARGKLTKHFASLAGQLGEKVYLLGEQMTIADAYLFWALLWAPKFGIEIAENLRAYFSRMRDLPSVARALAEEGLAAA